MTKHVLAGTLCNIKKCRNKLSTNVNTQLHLVLDLTCTLLHVYVNILHLRCF